MIKTKRQLRAEAVERLNDVHYGGDAVEFCAALLGERWNGENLRERIAELLTDDEPPEGDAVKIMRKAAKGGFPGSKGNIIGNAKVLLGVDGTNGIDGSCVLNMLADMVERDYVRRDDFNEMCERHRKEHVYWHNEMHAVLDTLNGKERFWGACMEYPLDECSLSPSEIAKQALERDYVPRKQWAEAVRAMKAAQDRMEQARIERDEYHKIARDNLALCEKRLKERDEWKAKAEQLANGSQFRDATKMIRGGSLEYDTREKLEADVRDLFGAEPTCEVIMRWLDRQAAITRRETLLENPLHNNPYVGLVRGKRWERKENSDYYCGRCGWKVTDHDSYCPECGGALHRAPNQPTNQPDAPKTAETAENGASKCEIRDFDDSREKLEADVYDGFRALDETEQVRDIWRSRVHGWLNRQADITAREWCHAIDGLSDENDRLLAEVEAYRGEYEDMEFIVSIDEAMKFTTDPPGYVKKALADLQARVDELRAERDELKEANEYHKLQYELACKDVDELRERLQVAKANPATLFASGRFDCKGLVEEAAQLRARIDELEAAISERYVELPVDADGILLEIGDKLKWRDEDLILNSLVWDGVDWCATSMIYSTDWKPVCRCHHVCEPRTLEDVLADVRDGNLDTGDAADEIRGMFGGDAE